MFSVDALSTISKDGENFVLKELFTFTRPNGKVIVVPVGAESDGASTPWFLWFFLPPFGLYWMAAFLHDRLYRGTWFPKHICDTIFLEAMKAEGVGRIKRNILYYGVKWGGYWSFKNDRRIERRHADSIHPKHEELTCCE